MAENNDIDEFEDIDSVLEESEDIDSELGEVVEITITYTGSESDDTITSIDPTTHAISVTIKPTWVNSVSDLPEVGSANVIYGIRNDSKFAVWDSANSEYAFFGYVLTATEKTKLGTLIEMLDNDQFGNVDDVQVDNNSVVDANKIAKFLTINGNYNASTNKLATGSDLPTSTSDLTNDGDGESPFATEDYVGTYGGKIDSISVNNTPQTIDANKNVNITVPTQASDVHALSDSTKYGASLGVSGTTVQLKDQDGNNLGSSITTQDTGATSVETTGSGNAVTSVSYDSSTRKITLTKGTEFQTATDNSLNTASKTVTGAINEVNTVAKNANIAKGFTSYQSLITELNSASSTAYKVGQSFYVQTLEVPDLWIISIEESSSSYTYTTDSAFVTATSASGGQQVGYYKLAQQETQKVDLTNYVQKTTTIAGVDLQDNITKSELLTALNVADGAQVNTLESISVNGTTQTIDEYKNVDLTIPTKLTNLINDGNFVTDSGYVHTDNNYTTTEKNKLSGIADGAQVNAIESISSGGTALTPDANKNVNIPYAGTNAGVISTKTTYSISTTNVGELVAQTKTSTQYTSMSSSAFISKGTLENIKSNYIKEGVTANTNILTDAEKTSAQNWIGASPRGIARLV